MDDKPRGGIAFHLNCLAHGGAERVVVNLSERFAKAGYRVLIATEWEEEVEYPLSDRVQRVHVGLRKQDEKRGRIAKFLLRIKYLQEFMDEYQPDVVVAFAQRALYRALEAKGNRKTHVVIAPRIHPVGNYDHVADKIQMGLFFKKASGAVFQTEAMREFFQPHLSVETKVILNPVSEVFAKTAPVRPERKEVVHAARLVDFKNQLLLIRAFTIVHERFPEYVLRIYGADAGEGMEEKLRAEIKRQDAGSYIFLMGESNRLQEVLPGAACFAYSSDYEGMPNALLEAMVMGLPVVSTDCPPGGPAMLIKDKVNGLLVPVGDKEALAEGICEMITHPEEAARMGAQARKLLERTDIECVFAQWEAYLQRVSGIQPQPNRMQP